MWGPDGSHKRKVRSGESWSEIRKPEGWDKPYFLQIPSRNGAPSFNLSCRLGQYLLEKSLLGCGLAQFGVSIHVGRQPALESFGVEDWAMNRVVVAHG